MRTIRPCRCWQSSRPSPFASCERALKQAAGLFIETSHSAEFLVLAELCFLDRGLEDANGLIIDLQRHRVGMTVLPTMCEREPRRIGETAWRAVNDFGDHGKRLHR